MLDAVSRAGRTGHVERPGRHGPPDRVEPDPEVTVPTLPMPDPRDPTAAVERENLKAVLQVPGLASAFDELAPTCFTAPAYVAVRDAVVAAGGLASVATGAVPPGEAWVDRVRTAAQDAAVARLVTELAVEPLRAEGEPDGRYVSALLARLDELDLARGRRDAALEAAATRSGGRRRGLHAGCSASSSRSSNAAVTLTNAPPASSEPLQDDGRVGRPPITPAADHRLG